MEPGVAPPNLVGRAGELQRLEAALAASADGRGSTMLIGGEAGIGKTRLASELGERAREVGATVLSGRCIDLVGSGLPYLPLVEALRQLCGSPALADAGSSLRELSRLVPELSEPGAPMPANAASPDSQLRLFEETLGVLERVSAEVPLVLVLEDLHWADGSTLDLVAFLAHAAREQRMLIVATYRSDELTPESSLRRLVAELVRAREAAALTLEPLGRDEIAQLLAGIAEAPLPAALVDEIYERSDGNPFFAEELVAAAERGEDTLPQGLRDALLQRLAGLDGETRSLLRIAAAAGRDVPFRLLAAVAPLSEAELVEALRQSVEHDVLAPDQPARSFRFRHALLAEAIYTTVLPGEREALHARLAGALRDDPALAASSIAGELAHHWTAAGRPVEALQASFEAARDAAAVSGPSEAFRHLQRVLDLWPQVDDSEALLGLDLPAILAWAAEVAFFAGSPGQAAELIRRAISMADPADEVRVGLLHERLGWFLLPGGVDREAGLAAHERAVELVPEQPPSGERARVLAALGGALNSFWRHDESRAACEEALAVANAIGDDRSALLALTVLGFDLYFLGRTSEGIECLHDARRRARTLGAAPDELRTYISLSDLLLYAGRLSEAARDALEGLAVARRGGYERSGGTLLAANAAEALLGLGDWVHAEEVLHAALRAAGSFRPEALYILRAELALGRGELEEARRYLESGSRAALEPQSAAAYACLQAELAFWEGHPENAARALDAVSGSDAPGAVKIRAARVCALALRAEAELAQLAAVRRDAAGVEEARRRAKRLVERARCSAVAAAAVMPDAAGWLAIAEAEHARVEGRSSPVRWQSAIAVWDGLQRPHLAAYCRWRYAEALLSAGSSRMEAAIPAREAHRIASDLGARSLQGELELLAQRARLDLAGLGTDQQRDPENVLGLTAREGEVLQLLARGRTNREIAAELTISVKTASVHVSHILRKLDVSSRLEAAAIAQRLTPDARAPSRS
jgi:DNA-binding CsgD family transcriptional regulator/tetratricopeptide (TPR) repeat protein